MLQSEEDTHLIESLEYNPETGEIRWKVRPESQFKNSTVWKRTNNKHAGTLAGYINNISGIDYLVIKVRQKAYLGHRLAWFLHFGEHPSGLIDHIDGDGTNNRIDNLRIATPSQNARNCKLFSTSSSGTCGVYWVERTKKWRSKGSYRVNGMKINVHLGYFRNKEDAIKARRDWEKTIGDFTERHGT